MIKAGALEILNEPSNKYLEMSKSNLKKIRIDEIKNKFH